MAAQAQPQKTSSFKTVDLVDSEELGDDIIQIASNQAMVSSLLLAFTYVISGDQVDLGELSIHGNPICSGWKGYRGQGMDFQFEDECSSCQNVWATCEGSDNVVLAIQAFNFFATLFFIVNVTVNVAQVQLFARLPKAGAKMFYNELGVWLAKWIPNGTIFNGMFMFTIAFFLQASLVFPPEGFWPILLIGATLTLFGTHAIFLMNRANNKVKNFMKSVGAPRQ